MDGEETQVLSTKLIGPTFHHCVLFPLKLECHLPLSVNIEKNGTFVATLNSCRVHFFFESLMLSYLK